MLTLIAFAGGFGWYLWSGVESLPPGSYPIFFFIIPVLLAAVAFFLATAFILERIGVRIYRRRVD